MPNEKIIKASDPDYTRIMGIATGFGAFVIIDIMAITMIVKGYKEAMFYKG